MNTIEYVLRKAEISERRLAKVLRIDPSLVALWRRGALILPHHYRELDAIADLMQVNIAMAPLLRDLNDDDRWIAVHESLAMHSEQGGPLPIRDQALIFVPEIMVMFHALGCEIPGEPPAVSAAGCDFSGANPVQRAYLELAHAHFEHWGPMSRWCSRFLGEFAEECPVELLEIEFTLPALALKWIDQTILANAGIEPEAALAHAQQAQHIISAGLEDLVAEITEVGDEPQIDYFALVNADPDDLEDMVAGLHELELHAGNAAPKVIQN